MPDWTEHAVSIAAILGGFCMLLVGSLWGLLRVLGATKEQSITAAIQKLDGTVQGLASRLETKAEKWDQRFDLLSHKVTALEIGQGTLHEALDEVKSLCRERRGGGRRTTDMAPTDPLAGC